MARLLLRHGCAIALSALLLQLAACDEPVVVEAVYPETDAVWVHDVFTVALSERVDLDPREMPPVFLVHDTRVLAAKTSTFWGSDTGIRVWTDEPSSVAGTLQLLTSYVIGASETEWRVDPWHHERVTKDANASRSAPTIAAGTNTTSLQGPYGELRGPVFVAWCEDGLLHVLKRHHGRWFPDVGGDSSDDGCDPTMSMGFLPDNRVVVASGSHVAWLDWSFQWTWAEPLPGHSPQVAVDRAGNVFVAARAPLGMDPAVRVLRWYADSWTEVGEQIPSSEDVSFTIAVDEEGKPILALADRIEGASTIHVLRYDNGWIEEPSISVPNLDWTSSTVSLILVRARE